MRLWRASVRLWRDLWWMVVGVLLISPQSAQSVIGCAVLMSLAVFAGWEGRREGRTGQ